MHIFNLITHRLRYQIGNRPSRVDEVDTIASVRVNWRVRVASCGWHSGVSCAVRAAKSHLRLDSHSKKRGFGTHIRADQVGTLAGDRSVARSHPDGAKESVRDASDHTIRRRIEPVRGFLIPPVAQILLRVFLFLAAIPLGPFAAVAFDDAPTYRLTNGQEVAPLEVFRECDVCPEMIVMPMGSFMMGAKPEDSRNPFDFFGANPSMKRREPGELNIIPHEHPRHLVEIDIPYAIGRNEVTHAEWMACVEVGACAHVPDHRVLKPNGYTELGPRHPVMNVSYLDMQEYLAWLNAMVGAEVYRLPTEVEWEYAARAGTDSRFAQGDELSPDQANFSGVGTERLRGTEMPGLTNRRMPVPVDELDAANAWGLRHMAGNVRERTRSCWTETHPGLATSSAYLALSRAQSECERVSKGGAYSGAMDFARPAARGSADEYYRSESAGFRVVRQMKIMGDE